MTIIFQFSIVNYPLYFIDKAVDGLYNKIILKF